MNLENLKIGMQLRLGFWAMLLFVMVLGAVAYRQSSQLHPQTETMYNHPIKTRNTIGEITQNLLLLQMNIREYLLVEDLVVRQTALKGIAVNQANVLNEIDKLQGKNLGPREDIDELNREFILWNSILQETIIDLPKMNGIAAFKIIRQDAALQHIPVIAVTASAMVADREIILAEGMDAYIPKPIDEKAFSKTIKSVLYER